MAPVSFFCCKFTTYSRKDARAAPLLCVDAGAAERGGEDDGKDEAEERDGEDEEGVTMTAGLGTHRTGGPGEA